MPFINTTGYATSFLPEMNTSSNSHYPNKESGEGDVSAETEEHSKFWKTKRLFAPWKKRPLLPLPIADSLQTRIDSGTLVTTRSCGRIRSYINAAVIPSSVRRTNNKKPRISESRRAIIRSHATNKHHRRLNTFFSLDEVLTEICKDWNKSGQSV
jgi:hypothetical protein